MISGTEYHHFVYVIFFPGSAAFRTSQGSPFIEIFYQVVSEDYQTSSLKEMRCRISDEMKRRETVHQGKVMTVPSASTSLTKSIYFSKYVDWLLCLVNVFSICENMLNTSTPVLVLILEGSLGNRWI